MPEIPFVFAGSGPLEDLLKDVPNIRNVGFQTGDALKKLISEARFTVYPSEWYENCPFSVMESQMYGTPVLGANIGGIPELIEVGKTGELFESGDRNNLLNKMNTFWADQALLDQYSRKCQFIRLDSIFEYTEKLMLVYTER